MTVISKRNEAKYKLTEALKALVSAQAVVVVALAVGCRPRCGGHGGAECCSGSHDVIYC